VLTNHALTPCTLEESVSQAIWLRLSRFRGEYFLDLESGLSVLEDKVVDSVLRDQIKTEVMKVQYVTAIESITTSMSNSVLSVDLRVKAGNTIIETSI
jgi:hypothetical protein